MAFNPYGLKRTIFYSKAAKMISCPSTRLVRPPSNQNTFSYHSLLVEYSSYRLSHVVNG